MDGWRSDGVLAWTDRDGPGRPPAGPNRHLLTGLGVGLVGVFSVILTTDTLCPEHRAWVQSLAMVALAGAVGATIGLFRRWAIAPALALGVTACGVAIGVIDSVHSTSRGTAIALAFAVLTGGALVLCAWQARLALWDRAVRRDLRSVAPADAAAVGPGVAAEHELAADGTRTQGSPEVRAEVRTDGRATSEVVAASDDRR
jgi:hypothetical protein